MDRATSAIRSHKQKYLLRQDDFEYPYRIVAPTFSLDVQRLQTKEEASKLFLAISDMGHQAIMSYIDIKSCKVRLLAYSGPTKRKE